MQVTLKRPVSIMLVIVEGFKPEMATASSMADEDSRTF